MPTGFFLHNALYFPGIKGLPTPFHPILGHSPATIYSVAIGCAGSLTPGHNCVILNIVKSCDEDPACGKKPREESILL